MFRFILLAALFVAFVSGSLNFKSSNALFKKQESSSTLSKITMIRGGASLGPVDVDMALKLSCVGLTGYSLGHLFLREKASKRYFGESSSLVCTMMDFHAISMLCLVLVAYLVRKSSFGTILPMLKGFHLAKL
jgi:hypothetical protein